MMWMLVIFTASTDLMSAEHTSRFITPLLHWLGPQLSTATVLAVQFCVRKAAHVTEYAILAALLARAFRSNAGRLDLRAALRAFAIAASYAALDEFHQSFVASRTAAPTDVLIDICGALLGLAIYWTCSPTAVLAWARTERD